MKFVDEATIRVEAGKGGNGSLSFRREKYVPRGGPDGGDGGDGGSIFIYADRGINTLVEFRYQRIHKAENGASGAGRLRSGKKGEDLMIAVPVGTIIINEDTDEVIADLVKAGDKVCVANGGRRGLGNAQFKSSTNRAPRKTTNGTLGEQRNLKLELKLLADVGLLGLPNAGKSTFIRSVSNATPKIADYPFTTLRPHLGVVRVEQHKSFFIADIPGLIEGASQGAGLGIQFLKHLSRTKLLLHVVDIAPIDGSDPLSAIDKIHKEVEQFSQDLSKKPCWLVLNKIDLLPAEQVDNICDGIINHLRWQGPSYRISAVNREGTKQLCYDLMRFLDAEEE